MTIRPPIPRPRRTEEEKRKALYDAVNRYERRWKKSYRMTVNKKYEKDIIKWLDEHRPYQTAIKTLVREQIKREKAERRKKKVAPE